jgi:hypothetical protein
MSVVLVFDPTSVYFGPIAVGSVSVPLTATLANEGTQTAKIFRANIPVNFTGKYSSDSTYVSTLGEVKLGRPFLPGMIYYQATDGSITADESETGVQVGVGTAQKTLMLTLGEGDIILDEEGNAILDELGEPILSEL